MLEFKGHDCECDHKRARAGRPGRTEAHMGDQFSTARRDKAEDGCVVDRLAPPNPPTCSMHSLPRETHLIVANAITAIMLHTEVIRRENGKDQTAVRNSTARIAISARRIWTALHP